MISKRERLKIANKKLDKKRKEISERRENDEIKRLKQSQSLKLSSMFFKMAKNNEKSMREKKIKEKVEKEKALKEKHKQE